MLRIYYATRIIIVGAFNLQTALIVWHFKNLVFKAGTYRLWRWYKQFSSYSQQSTIAGHFPVRLFQCRSNGALHRDLEITVTSSTDIINRAITIKSAVNTCAVGSCKTSQQIFFNTRVLNSWQISVTDRQVIVRANKCHLLLQWFVSRLWKN